MADSPTTLPADYFSKPQSAQANPETLPANFFAQNAPGAAKPPAPVEHSIGGFLSNAVDSGKKFAGDVAGAVRHPVDTMFSVVDMLQGGAEKLVGLPPSPKEQAPKPGATIWERLTGPNAPQQTATAVINHFKERYGSLDKAKEALYKDPVGVMADVSTVLDGAGVVAEAGKLGTVAKVAKTAAEFSDPLRLAGKAAVGTAKLATKGADATATALTRGALKGGLEQIGNTKEPAKVALIAKDNASAVAEMGAQNAPFSQKGIDKIHTALNDVRQEIEARVQSAQQQGLAVDPRRVQLRADETRKKFGMQVNPDTDLRDIDKVADNFSRNNPGPIPVGQAQGMKVGSNSLNGPKYGKISTAQVEAEKALTRGLKEELENQIPELAGLNERQARLMNVEEVLTRAVTKYTNSGGFLNSMKKSLGSGASKVVAGLSGAGAVASHSGGVAVAGGAADLMMAVLSDPRVKQRLAITINQAQKLNPTKFGTPSMRAATARVAGYAASLATAGSRVEAAQE